MAPPLPDDVEFWKILLVIFAFPCKYIAPPSADDNELVKLLLEIEESPKTCSTPPPLMSEPFPPMLDELMQLLLSKLKFPNISSTKTTPPAIALVFKKLLFEI